MRELLASRKIDRIVVLGANGTMGYGCAALFTQAVPHVTFLARSQAKAEEGLAAMLVRKLDPLFALLGGHTSAGPMSDSSFGMPRIEM